ncbi:hypothetical protein HZB03_04975 [Candidatus Woesearchaeota archaeon]|nr:hypothetical protein [Candidatus Woesearchaeota archaeon]
MVSTVVIANLNSRKNRRDKDKSRIKHLRKIVGSHGIVFPTKSLDDLLEHAIPFIQKYKPDVVASDSGDGGLVPLITALVEQNGVPIRCDNGCKKGYFPYIAPTAGGTQNVFSKRCGLTTKREVTSYLTEIVQAKSKEELFVENFDLMKIEDDRGLSMYGFTFGVGMPVTLLEEYYKNKDARYVRIAWLVTRCITSYLFYKAKKGFGLQPRKEAHFYAQQIKNFYEIMNVKFPIRVNSEEAQDYLAIMAQTIPSIGMTWSNMFYRAEKAQRQFHVLGTKANVDEVLLYLPAIYLGKPTLIVNDHLDVQTSDMTVSSDVPLHYQVNGELDYLGNKLSANSIRLSYGLTLDIIKTKGTP